MSISIFNDAIANGSVLRGLVVPGIAEKPGSFFKTLDAWAKDMGSKGLGYITHKNQELKGPLVKFCSPDTLDTIKAMVPDQGVIFFVCDAPKMANSFAGQLRTHLGNLLDLVDESAFSFCWVVDFPMYEKTTKQDVLNFPTILFLCPRADMKPWTKQTPWISGHFNTTWCAMALNCAAVQFVTTNHAQWKKLLPLPVTVKTIYTGDSVQ
jgi:aspartyl-tRNA synthetase